MAEEVPKWKVKEIMNPKGSWTSSQKDKFVERMQRNEVIVNPKRRKPHVD